MISKRTLALLFVSILPAPALAADAPRGAPRETVEICAGDLAFVVRDNS